LHSFFSLIGTKPHRARHTSADDDTSGLFGISIPERASLKPAIETAPEKQSNRQILPLQFAVSRRVGMQNVVSKKPPVVNS